MIFVKVKVAVLAALFAVITTSGFNRFTGF
jgi:hypothetical protein